MASKRILIKNGQICGFADEITCQGVTLGESHKIRVSHVFPKNRMLRWAFRMCRATTGDNSRIANWTRNWDCKWIVVISNVKFGPFYPRNEAIRFEKNKLHMEGRLFEEMNKSR